MTISDISPSLIPITIGSFWVFNTLRYFKYGKLITFGLGPYMESYTYKFNAILGLVIGLFFLLLGMQVIPLILAPFWLLFTILFFYWYWNTKEDPFHYERRVWQDPRDKKKS